MQKKRFITVMIGLMMVQSGFAATLEQYWPKQGWLWYNKPVKEVRIKVHKLRVQSLPSRQVQTLTASQQMSSLRHATKEALDKAILYPSEQHTLEYLRLQRFLTEKASDFTTTWQKTLLDHPELDYGVSHPMQSLGRQVMLAKENDQETQAIHEMAKHYGLFFFYRGKNKLDQALSSSIMAFAQDNHIALIPVTVDSRALSSMPDTRVDHGQAKRLGIKFFPALILVNPKTGEHKALSYGFISQNQLSKRFLAVATNFKRTW